MDDGLIEFCERVRPRLVGMLSLYLGDQGVAEELAQETLARVWTNWPKVSQLDAPAGWAHRVALNLANSVFRRRAAERRARERLIVDHNPVHLDPDGAEAVGLRRAVAALPPRQRSVVVLRFYADLSVDEVARSMACAPGTVKSLTHKAVAALRAATLVTEEVTDGSH